MDTEVAVRVYDRIKQNAARYYQQHKEEVLEKKKQRYRDANPNPRPRGRPRKVAAEPTSENPI